MCSALSCLPASSAPKDDLIITTTDDESNFQPQSVKLVTMGNIDSSNAYAGVDELKDSLTGLETCVHECLRALLVSTL